MEEKSLLEALSKKFKPLDGSATYWGTIDKIPKDGLFSKQLTNRASKSWPKAQVLHTSVQEQGNNSVVKCIERWKEVCSSYKDQYLIITDENRDILLFDYNGECIAKNDGVLNTVLSHVGKPKVERTPLCNVTSSDVNVNNQLSYLRAMRTKPFLLLAGISGTGKSRIVKQMAFDSCPDVSDLRKDLTSPGNYCLIEVKPNWHDSTELLGYESKIGGAHYQLTTFVKFLAKAMLFPDVPFFVCLDEMNLAPVEQYFAEFLSVLESRTKKNGHIVSEPLIKAEIFRKYSSLEKSLFSKEGDENASQDSLGIDEPEAPYGKEAEVFEYLKEHGLRIPENVVVIGTVNMDETTHQFSRKVIDRAMTIEMNLPEGDPFMDFFKNSSNLEYREEPTSVSLYLSTEVKAADIIEILTSESAEETESLKHQVANFLRGLNDALDKTPFQVAYRVQNELVLYFYQLWLENKSVAWSDILTEACDQILMMKVLPRIEGDEELLEEPLKRLSEFCQHYTNASKKLEFMTERLAQSRFASFWP